MKPQTGIKLYRTRNDTDPIALKLSYSQDGCLYYVEGSSFALLNIKKTPVLQIAGTSSGGGNFLFATSGLAGMSGDFAFEVEVNDGIQIYTLGTGTLTIYPDIA